MLFTFVDCLQHRLLCLTDAEICGEDPAHSSKNFVNAGCGFRADELLQVGASLRDLMLGLIDLSHPDQLPKCKAHVLEGRTPGENDKPFQTGTGGTDAPTFREVLDRIESRAEAVAAGTALDSFAVTRQRSGCVS